METVQQIHRRGARRLEEARYGGLVAALGRAGYGSVLTMTQLTGPCLVVPAAGGVEIYHPEHDINGLGWPVWPVVLPERGGRFGAVNTAADVAELGDVRGYRVIYVSTGPAVAAAVVAVLDAVTPARFMVA